MKILYDTYIYELQQTGGINRYTSEIISRLPETFHPYFFKKIKNEALVPKNKNFQFFWLPKILSKSPCLLRKRLQSMDLIHPSYYHLSAPLSWKNISGHVVITVHDFIMARFSNRYTRSQKVIHDQAMAIERADHIICVSQSTHADLLERFPQCASRSSVIPLASSLSLPALDAKRLYQQRYFLYVGHRNFYKNFYLTLQTFSILKKKYHDLRLVVVGAPWNEEEKQQLHSLGIENAVELVTHPQDALLAVLYKYCEALFYLSEYEGFGLPPLEAMKIGAPVIALKISSLPEVVGSGGVLIDPSQAFPEKIAEAVACLLDSEQERSALSEKAVHQASQFSWEKTMQKTLAIYEKFK
ncbi:MAG: glycosyltransferase family 4 protein [Verrucomicrobia bacterium]|nr:glycosyltransferase family 4 protein [Verrucomicrobiota bacterium]